MSTQLTLFSQLIHQYLITPTDYQYLQNRPMNSDELRQWVHQHCYQINPPHPDQNLRVYQAKSSDQRTAFDHDYYRWLTRPPPKILLTHHY